MPRPVRRLAVTIPPFFSWTGLPPSYTKLVVVPMDEGLVNVGAKEIIAKEAISARQLVPRAPGVCRPARIGEGGQVAIPVIGLRARAERG
jgi:hypothetical protein